MWESLSDCTILFNLQTGQVHGLLDHGLFGLMDNSGQQWTTVIMHKRKCFGVLFFGFWDSFVAGNFLFDISFNK